jgi:hypothetical protein
VTIDRQRAFALARARVSQIAAAEGDQFELQCELTKDTDRGWVFFFNTAEFVRTRNPLSALAGNGPIFVTREGAVHQLPSAIPWEDALQRM